MKRAKVWALWRWVDCPCCHSPSKPHLVGLYDDEEKAKAHIVRATHREPKGYFITPEMVG